MSASHGRSWLLALALGLPAACLAQDSPAPAWRDLSDPQKAALTQFARRWDRMPEARRTMILKRYARWQQLPEHKRRTLREGARNFGQMSPLQREKMRLSINAVRLLPVGEQRQLRRLWRSLTPRERLDWVERGGPGIAPPP